LACAGRGAVDSWNSFLFAPRGSAAQRIGSRSTHAIHRRAADLFCGCDGRHHQVAHGGETLRAHSLISRQARSVTQRVCSARCSFLRLSGATWRASPWEFSRSPRPSRGGHRKCGGPLSRCCRAAHAGFAGSDSAAKVLAGSAAGTGEEGTLCGRSCRGNLIRSCCSVAPAAFARALHSKSGRRLAQLRHAIRAVSRRPWRLVFGWLLGTSVQGTYVVLTALLGIACGLSLPLRVWLFAWPLAKSPL